jgi:hypothetical protein
MLPAVMMPKDHRATRSGDRSRAYLIGAARTLSERIAIRAPAAIAVAEIVTHSMTGISGRCPGST